MPRARIRIGDSRRTSRERGSRCTRGARGDVVARPGDDALPGGTRSRRGIPAPCATARACGRWASPRGAGNRSGEGQRRSRAEDQRAANGNSVGFAARFGGFDLLALGDLTWSYEDQLACPTNRLGSIDLYQTTHHGMAISGATQLVHGVEGNDAGHNAPDDFTANLEDGDGDLGATIHARVDADGTITMTNQRNAWSQVYASR